LKRDKILKTHPHLIPFSDCGYENNQKDRFIAKKGYYFLTK